MRANNIEKIQVILNKVNEFGELSELQINIAETRMMVISKHQRNSPVSINENKIDRRHEVYISRRYLK